MTTEIKEYRERLAVEFEQLFDATEEALNEWEASNVKGNLQFPTLLTTLTVRFNWDEKTMRENDPIIRKYTRKHPKWYVTRGAKGGIMRRAEWDEKNAVKLAKDLAKQQMQEAIQAKVDAAKASSNPAPDSE